MKAFNKYFALAAAACLSLAFTACSDSDDYTPATAEANDQVYFAIDEPTTLDVSKTGTSFEVPIHRVKTDDAINVPLTLTDSTGIYSIPSSVAFEKGSAESVVTVTYNPDKLVYDEFTEVSITIDPAYQTAYGLSTYTFNVGAYSPYQSIGTGYYIDAFYGDGDYHAVDIQQNTLTPNVYRIINPYEKMADDLSVASPYIQITLLEPGNTIGDVTITMSGLVDFETFNTGIYVSKYSTYLKGYHPRNFKSYASEDKWTYSKVVDYKEDGTPGQIQLAPVFYMDGVGGYATYSQSDGLVEILMPDYTPKDYNLTCEYGGYEENSAVGVGYAYATVSTGDDVDKCICVVVEGGADPDEIAEGVEKGTVVGVEPNSNGEVSVPIPSSEPGFYQMVVVCLDDGNVVASDVITFLYRYTYVGSGDYTFGVTDLTGKDDPVFSGVDEGLGLYQNDTDASAFAIYPWVRGGALMFTHDTTTNNLTIAKSWTNYYTSYGNIFGFDLTSYGLVSTFADNTYSFMLGYGVDAGTFGYEEDTFTLNSESSARKKASQHKMKIKPYMIEKPVILK